MNEILAIELSLRRGLIGLVSFLRDDATLKSFLEDYGAEWQLYIETEMDEITLPLFFSLFYALFKSKYGDNIAARAFLADPL